MHLDLGLATLKNAQADLSAGVSEASRNDGPRIREMAARFGLVPPLNWCAVALSTWLQEAAEEYGFTLPIKGSAAAQGVMAQMIEKGLWVKTSNIKNEVLRAGNIIVWKRPPHNWTGHIGIILDRKDEFTLLTIEGNSGPKGDKVAMMERELTHPSLLGIGRLRNDGLESDTLEDWELEEMERLSKLSSEVMAGIGFDPLDLDKWDEEHS